MKAHITIIVLSTNPATRKRNSQWPSITSKSVLYYRQWMRERERWSSWQARGVKRRAIGEVRDGDMTRLGRRSAGLVSCCEPRASWGAPTISSAHLSADHNNRQFNVTNGTPAFTYRTQLFVFFVPDKRLLIRQLWLRWVCAVVPFLIEKGLAFAFDTIFDICSNTSFCF